MAFDAAKFNQEKLTARTADVDVPSLASFFAGEGNEPIWKVRGLSGAEVAKANEAQEAVKNITAITQALLSAGAKDKGEAVKQLIGLGDDVPGDIVRRISLLQSGSVDPVVDQGLAVRLAEFYPLVFYAITNKILELTGQGPALGKQKGSGKTPESK